MAERNGPPGATIEHRVMKLKMTNPRDLIECDADEFNAPTEFSMFSVCPPQGMLRLDERCDARPVVAAMGDGEYRDVLLATFVSEDGSRGVVVWANRDRFVEQIDCSFRDAGLAASMGSGFTTPIRMDELLDLVSEKVVASGHHADDGYVYQYDRGSEKVVARRHRADEEGCHSLLLCDRGSAEVVARDRRAGGGRHEVRLRSEAIVQLPPGQLRPDKFGIESGFEPFGNGKPYGYYLVSVFMNEDDTGFAVIDADKDGSIEKISFFAMPDAPELRPCTCHECGESKVAVPRRVRHKRIARNASSPGKVH
jgi:hypothetical protein